MKVIRNLSEGNGRILKRNSRGVVRWFNKERGFGFATDDEFGDVFVHRGNIVVADLNPYADAVVLSDGSEDASVSRNDWIEYDVLKHTSGNLQAKNITAMGGRILVYHTTDQGTQVDPIYMNERFQSMKRSKRRDEEDWQQEPRRESERVPASHQRWTSVHDNPSTSSSPTLSASSPSSHKSSNSSSDFEEIWEEMWSTVQEGAPQHS